ncbi:hypothetical protein OSTOST_20135 [Ostertagia ostertagi]
MDLDTVGHYSRPDVFQLTVNEKPLKTVSTNAGITTATSNALPCFSL